MSIFTKTLTAATISTMSAFAVAGPVDLGTADAYTMLAVGTTWDSAGGGVLILGSEAEIFGNVGARNYLALAAGAKIHGNADGGHIAIGAGASIDGSQNKLSESDWSGLYNDLAKASSIAAALTGLNYGSVTSTMIFSAYDTISVFNIAGELNLDSQETLTLSGDADDMFVVNVSENFMLGSGAAILLDGISAENVLFNFTGGGSVEAAVLGGAEFSGTYIAPNMDWIIGDGATLNNTRVLVSGSIANVQVVKPGETTTTTTTVPAPASVFLMLMSLIGLVLVRKKA